METEQVKPVTPVYYRQNGKYYEERSGRRASFAEVLASVQRGREIIDQFRGVPVTRPEGREWTA